MRRFLTIRLRGASAAAACFALLGAIAPQSARAELCALKVFQSLRGQSQAEREIGPGGLVRTWARGDQFIVCVTPMTDGVISLWDRMEASGVADRLAPNEVYTGPGERAIPVAGGREVCLGDGSDGYWLQMDPRDGVGLGRLWIVFSTTEADHPGEETYSEIDELATLYERFGAGAVTSRGADGLARAGRGEDGSCAPRASVEVDYRVE